MLKNIQIKIVIIFMILGIVTLGVQGILFMHNLQHIAQNAVGYNEVQDMVVKEAMQARNLTIFLTIAFIIVSVVVAAFLIKVIINPMNRLTKSAEKVAKNKKTSKALSDGKNRTEVDELTEAFEMMDNELTENLNEVTRQKKQIETILLHMNDGILAFNINGDIIHKNRAAENLFSLTGEEKNFDDIFGKIDVDVNLEKIIYLEDWTTTQAKVVLGDKTLNLFFAAFKDETERPSGAVVVIQDITEHVALDTMRTEFVADVSHELKTPITSIMGYADTLEDDECDLDTRKKFLTRISTQAQRMANLVSDLLTLSRYDADMMPNNPEEFDLGDLVKNIYDSLSLEIEKKNQKAECYVTADVPHVVADKTGIERVVTNILTNAIKYTPDEGEIKIYVGFAFNDAYIKVIDNGIGIPEEDLQKVFERFYRVDKARTREMGGTGLGLSIAKEILDRNNSKIDIKSKLRRRYRSGN